jgi:two-component system, response regulator PdtaR
MPQMHPWHRINSLLHAFTFRRPSVIWRQRCTPAGVGVCEMAYPPAAKGPAVLIVEDEALVRAGAVDLVEEAGFEAIEAANADEAIRILESRHDVMVVFTDIDMPGSMDGLKLAHAVRNRWPPIKLVVTSGHSLPTDKDLPKGGRFMGKPYGPSQVATFWELIAEAWTQRGDRDQTVKG